METPAPQPKNLKPVGGFIVVLVSAVLIGGWLYVDMVRNEMERKVEGLESQLEAARMQGAEEASSGPEQPQPEAPEWQAYAGEIGGHRFQISLPETHQLTVQGDGSAAFIVMKPTSEVESFVPDASINLVGAGQIGGTTDARSVVVATSDGKAAFRLSVWEDFEWPEFGRVAASFKAL